MAVDFLQITSIQLENGYSSRADLPSEVARLKGLKDTRSLRLRLAEQTNTLTLLAGSGSRWVSSIIEARNVLNAQNKQEDRKESAGSIRSLKDVFTVPGAPKPADLVGQMQLDPTRGADTEEPRGLFPVRNALGFGPNPEIGRASCMARVYITGVGG